MKKNYYFMIAAFVLVAGGCSKDDKDDSPSNGGGGGTSGITIDSPWQYSIVVDGTTHAKTDNDADVDGVWSNSVTLNTPPDSTINNYNSALYNDNTLETYFEVYRNGHKYLGATAEDSIFLEYFEPGSYPYSQEDFNGVSIYWYDSNGVQWGTDLGTGDQTGSQYVIDQVKVLTGYGYYTIKVLAHFNCTLYNGSGQSKTLTSGQYVSLFQNFW